MDDDSNDENDKFLNELFIIDGINLLQEDDKTENGNKYPYAPLGIVRYLWREVLLQYFTLQQQKQQEQQEQQQINDNVHNESNEEEHQEDNKSITDDNSNTTNKENENNNNDKII